VSRGPLLSYLPSAMALELFCGFCSSSTVTFQYLHTKYVLGVFPRKDSTCERALFSRHLCLQAHSGQVG
jgi:hypothetical protein